MQYVTFSKLKAYKKAKSLSKKIKELAKSIPKIEQNNLRSRIIENSNNTLETLKLIWVKCRIKEDFIYHMDHLIVNNSELELLFFEANMNGYIDAEIYEHLLADCDKLRELQLQMFNNASVYFDEGKAPENWFDLE